MTLGPGAAELLDELPEDLFALLDIARATGKAGEIVDRAVLDSSNLSNPDLALVLLVGVGEGSPDDLRKAGAALARRTKGRTTLATSLAALTDDAGLRALVEGLVLGSFEFHWRSTGPQEQPVARVVLAGLADTASRKPALDRALAVAGAGWMSRTLALVPSNEKNPAWMAERATEVAASAWPEDQGLGREEARRRGLRRHRRGRAGVGEPAAARAARLHAAQGVQEDPARRAGRQGHHLRHRRAVDQAQGRDDADEARHDRRRRGARGHGCAGRRSTARSG